MTQPVLQSLLVDHIQRISGERRVLTTLYLIMDYLYDASLVLGDFSSWSRVRPIKKKFKLFFIVVFFQMVHNEKIFRRSSVKYRTFSEGPT